MEQKCDFDDENRAIINLNIYDDSNFLSPYSANTSQIINDEVASFLENQVKLIKIKYPLTIIINSNCIDEKEKIIYTDALRRYYMNNKNEYQFEKRKVSIIVLIFFVVSVSILVTHFFYRGNNNVILEIIDIIAWVFMWEAVDKFCIERFIQQRQVKRCQNFIDAKIIYKELDNQE